MGKLLCFDVPEVFEIFAEAAPEGYLDRRAFHQCFDYVIAAGGGHDSPADEAKAYVVVDRLFNTFDTDGNGVVDYAELASGLSVLCTSSMSDKINNAFRLFDLDGDGVITLDEMETYMTSVFRVMFETSPAARASAGGVAPEALAVATAQQCFAEADLNHDGKLSKEEFARFLETPSGAAFAR